MPSLYRQRAKVGGVVTARPGPDLYEMGSDESQYPENVREFWPEELPEPPMGK